VNRVAWLQAQHKKWKEKEGKVPISCEACKKEVASVSESLGMGLCPSCKIVASRIKSFPGSILYMTGKIHGVKYHDNPVSKEPPQPDPHTHVLDEIRNELPNVLDIDLADAVGELKSSLAEWQSIFDEAEKATGERIEEPETLPDVIRKLLKDQPRPGRGILEANHVINSNQKHILNLLTSVKGAVVLSIGDQPEKCETLFKELAVIEFYTICISTATQRITEAMSS